MACLVSANGNTMSVLLPHSPIIKRCNKCSGAGFKVRVNAGKVVYQRCNKCFGARGRYGNRKDMVFMASIKRPKDLVVL